MTPSTTAIPEGHELLAQRSPGNAKKAIALAEKRGYDSSAVLTIGEGYLIPIGDDEIDETDETVETAETEIEIPAKSATKSEQEAFASEHGIDLTDTKNAEERHAAIEAWAAAQTGAADTKEN